MTETREQKAQRLVDEGRVKILKHWKIVVEAVVQEDQESYVVDVYDTGRFFCTCPWGAFHSYTDDLCAHALAVKLAASLGSP